MEYNEYNKIISVAITMHKYCAPSKSGESGTCFSHDALHKMAEAWNKEYPDQVISSSKSKKALWKEIRKRMIAQAPCDEDYCLLDMPLVKEASDRDMRSNTFRPEMPKDWIHKPKAWLSTIDIRQVLLQYSKHNAELLFIGPVPIDFDHKISFGQCVVSELCNLNLEDQYQAGKRYIGIVFNLDPHHMPGSHWVSLFVNMKNGGIYFFDSVGKFPVDEISKLMCRLRKQGNQLFIQQQIEMNSFSQEHAMSFPIKQVTDGQVDLDGSITVPPYAKGMPIIFDYQEQDGGRTTASIRDITGNTLYLDNIQETRGGTNTTPSTIVVMGFRLFYNDIRHQSMNTECGVYSIYFIDCLLAGDSFRSFTKKLIKDNEMNKKRKIYFRPFRKKS